jgi:hypothetical protein
MSTTDNTPKGFVQSVWVTDIAFSILLAVLLIIRYGFTLGTGDHVELLPYVKYLANPALYTHDFFITHLHASLPNERTVFAHLLLPFVSHLSSWMFVLHFINTVLLIWGLVRIGWYVLDNRYLTYLATIISILILNDKGLGNVDIYSCSLQAGDVSCMLIAWGLVAFFSERWWVSSLILVAATYVHPLEGLDVTLVLSLVMLWRYVAVRDISWMKVLTFSGIYAALAGLYLVPLYLAKTGGASTLTNTEYFWIMFEFRHPHHFIFRTFPHLNKLFFVLYTAAALLYFPVRQRKVARFVFIAIIGLILYITAVDFMHLSWVANFQWYKVVQWTKFFGIIAIIGMMYDKTREFLPLERYMTTLNTILIALAVVGLVYISSLYISGTFAQDYHRGTDGEIAFCRGAGQVLPTSAVVIQPFAMTGFKYYAERSSYVEFKAIPKNRKDVQLWYSRIGEVYGLDYMRDNEGFGMAAKADTYLNTLTRTQLDSLHKEGVTHAIFTTTRPDLGATPLLAVQGYYLYAI